VRGSGMQIPEMNRAKKKIRKQRKKISIGEAGTNIIADTIPTTPVIKPRMF